MRQVRAKNTKPERELRSLLHRAGYRFRLHRSDLPGRPDIVFPTRRKIIFVHGCFWHQHRKCRKASIPKSRLDYWIPKLQQNAERDEANRMRLHQLGWDVFVVWQCEMRDEDAVTRRLAEFLGPPRRAALTKPL